MLESSAAPVYRGIDQYQYGRTDSSGASDQEEGEALEKGEEEEKKEENDPLDLLSIVKEQNPEGFWPSLDFLKPLLSSNTDFSAFSTQKGATLVALYVLHEKYGEKKMEWKLVARKAVNWLKS